MSRSTRTTLFVSAVAVMAALVGATAALAAGPMFGDVPDDHPFADEIGAMAEAGITTGGADGNFHPDAAVKRQAMAAFLGRGLGRIDGVGLGGGESYHAFPETKNLFSDTASVTAGAAGDGAGYVLVLANATASSTDEDDCPCQIRLDIIRAGTPDPIGRTSYETLTDDFTDNGRDYASMSAMEIIPVDAGERLDLQARLVVVDSDVDHELLQGHVEIVAVYVPFDGDGNVSADEH